MQFNRGKVNKNNPDGNGAKYKKGKQYLLHPSSHLMMTKLLNVSDVVRRAILDGHVPSHKVNNVTEMDISPKCAAQR